MEDPTNQKTSNNQAHSSDLLTHCKNKTYYFCGYKLEQHQLTKFGQFISLDSLPLALLRALAEFAVKAPGQPIEANELRQALWNGESRSDNLLASHFFTLRKALGQDLIPTRRYLLNATVQILADAGPASEGTTGAGWSTSPWPGASPFAQNRSEDFFGRDKECSELLEILSAGGVRAVLLYSVSGAGKTSLINTALRAALHRRGFDVLPTARVVYLGDRENRPGNPYTLSALESIEGAGLSQSAVDRADTWRTYLRRRASSMALTILIIDQFEEIVTGAQGVRHQRGFFTDLGHAIAENPGLRVLLAFREEYLASILRLTDYLGNVETHRYDMPMMTPQSAREAIVKPFQRRGVAFRDESVDRLLNELARVTRIDDQGETIEEFGDCIEPRHLSLTCEALWRSLEPGQSTIRWEDFDRAVDGSSSNSPDVAVRRLASSVLARVFSTAVNSASQQTGCREELIVLGCLPFIAEGGVRTQVRQGREWTGDLPNRVANALEASHLLRIEDRADARWFELAHDTLVKPVMDAAKKIGQEELRSVFKTEVANAANQAGLVGAEGLAQECRFVFVADDGNMRRVSKEELHSSRLPAPLVSELVSRQILRHGVHGSRTFYELVSPLMAQAIHNDRHGSADQVLHLRRLMAEEIKNSTVNGAPDYSNRDTLLAIARNLIDLASFSTVEVSFILQSSLATGFALDEFVQKLLPSSPSTVFEVVRSALRSKVPAVRMRAIETLRVVPLEDRTDLLVNHALGDADFFVRKTSARTIASLQELGSALDSLFGALVRPKTKDRALQALAWLCDTIDRSLVGEYEVRRASLGRGHTIRLLFRVWETRLSSSLLRMMLVWATAMFVTIFITVPPRAVVGGFGFTITQLSKDWSGFFEAGFHGVFGAILWSTFIGVSILASCFILEGRRPWTGKWAPLAGATGGLLGGVTNTVTLLTVYGFGSLTKMGWISSGEGDIFESIYVNGLALVMPIYGAAVGCGSGMALRRMLPWWFGLTTDLSSSRVEVKHVVTGTLIQAGAKSWPIALLLSAAAITATEILQRMPAASKDYTSVVLAGEAVSLYFGGLGLTIGTFLGLLLLRAGLSIPGESKEN